MEARQKREEAIAAIEAEKHKKLEADAAHQAKLFREAYEEWVPTFAEMLKTMPVDVYLFRLNGKVDTLERIATEGGDIKIVARCVCEMLMMYDNFIDTCKEANDVAKLKEVQQLHDRGNAAIRAIKKVWNFFLPPEPRWKVFAEAFASHDFSFIDTYSAIECFNRLKWDVNYLTDERNRKYDPNADVARWGCLVREILYMESIADSKMPGYRVQVDLQIDIATMMLDDLNARYCLLKSEPPGPRRRNGVVKFDRGRKHG